MRKSITLRRPWQDGVDDKYCARFIVKSLRLSIRSGSSIHDWFAGLPRNLQTGVYWSAAQRLIRPL